MAGTLITPDLVRLDADLGADKSAAIVTLTELVAKAGRSPDPVGLAVDVQAREDQKATGLPGGIAIPHNRSKHVEEPTVAFARVSPPIDFGAPDGPSDLVFLIAAPESGGDTHLQLLTQLVRALVRKRFTADLRAVETAEEAAALVSGAVKA